MSKLKVWQTVSNRMKVRTFPHMKALWVRRNKSFPEGRNKWQSPILLKRNHSCDLTTRYSFPYRQLYLIYRSIILWFIIYILFYIQSEAKVSLQLWIHESVFLYNLLIIIFHMNHTPIFVPPYIYKFFCIYIYVYIYTYILVYINNIHFKNYVTMPLFILKKA